MCCGSCKRESMISFALGQIICLFITGTGVFSTVLASGGVNIPTVQSSLNYILLTGHLIIAFPRARKEGLAVPAWQYLLWALVDVEANFCVVLAYQYTSITSVALLDCFTIPVAMFLSRVVIGAEYSKAHVAACGVCIFGLVLTVVSDNLQNNDSSPAPNGPAWFGDVLVLIGATLYGTSNVVQEWILKGSGRRCEALGMLGLWGSVISVIQALILERAAFATCDWTPELLLSLFGFQLCLFAMYVLTSSFLMMADATLFNLSLLTSDVYSVIYAWGAQGQRPTWVYAAAFSTTISGIALYHTRPPPTRREDREEFLAPGSHSFLEDGGRIGAAAGGA